MRNHVPNALTLMNLFCGCVALVMVFRGLVPWIAVMVAFSLLFDFLDGFSARAFKAGSALGKELDSLADLVSFGVVPGAILYHLFRISYPLSEIPSIYLREALSLLPFLVTVFSAFRLAKFNLDSRQTESFLGLPTPAATIFVTGLALVYHYNRFYLAGYLVNSYVIAGLSLLISYMLISGIKLFAFKFKSFGWKDNKNQYTLTIMGVILFYFLRELAIPLVIVLYVLLSVTGTKAGDHTNQFPSSTSS